MQNRIKEIETRLAEIKATVKWNDLVSYEEKQILMKEEYYLKRELYDIKEEIK